MMVLFSRDGHSRETMNLPAAKTAAILTKATAPATTIAVGVGVSEVAEAGCGAYRPFRGGLGVDISGRGVVIYSGGHHTTPSRATNTPSVRGAALGRCQDMR